MKKEKFKNDININFITFHCASVKGRFRKMNERRGRTEERKSTMLRKKDLFEFFIEVYIIITSCFVEFKNGGGFIRKGTRTNYKY